MLIISIFRDQDIKRVLEYESKVISIDSVFLLSRGRRIVRGVNSIKGNDDSSPRISRDLCINILAILCSDTNGGGILDNSIKVISYVHDSKQSVSCSVLSSVNNKVINKR